MATHVANHAAARARRPAVSLLRCTGHLGVPLLAGDR